MQNQLSTYLRAGHPGIVILTAEEIRAEAEIASACSTTGHRLMAWSSTDGLVDTSSGSSRPCADPLEALVLIEGVFSSSTGTRHAVVLRDFQPYLDQNDPLLLRRFKDLLRLAKSGGHGLMLLGCRSKLPPELEHEMVRLEFRLPDVALLGAVLDGIVASASVAPPDPGTRQRLLNAALGLTTMEAENAFAFSIAECGSPDPAIVAREKANALKSGGLVEVVESAPTLDRIGGLDHLKRWLTNRAKALSSEARAFGLPAPRGLLIVGIPGTGKSLTAKAASSAFGLPLLRLDMGRVFGGIVGQSEANLRSVIQTAEAIAPCVLWIDEIEKGFSGNQSSGSTDGGTSSRVFGSFLSWMQEKGKPVFVIATANDVSKLPPEFLRKGRFDELFFVDLPTYRERCAIWNLVIGKYRPGRHPFDVVALSRLTERYTGAEIEALFVEALHLAYEDGRDPAQHDVIEASASFVPIVELMDGEIARLRHWAKGRAREAAPRETPRPGKDRQHDN